MAARFSGAREHRRIAMRDLLWNDCRGQWLDLRWDLERQMESASVSNFTPLWAGMELLFSDAAPT